MSSIADILRYCYLLPPIETDPENQGLLAPPVDQKIDPIKRCLIEWITHTRATLEFIEAAEKNQDISKKDFVIAPYMQKYLNNLSSRVKQKISISSGGLVSAIYAIEVTKTSSKAFFDLIGVENVTSEVFGFISGAISWVTTANVNTLAMSDSFSPTPIQKKKREKWATNVCTRQCVGASLLSGVTLLMALFNALPGTALSVALAGRGDKPNYYMMGTSGTIAFIVQALLGRQGIMALYDKVGELFKYVQERIKPELKEKQLNKILIELEIKLNTLKYEEQKALLKTLTDSLKRGTNEDVIKSLYQLVPNAEIIKPQIRWYSYLFIGGAATFSFLASGASLVNASYSIKEGVNACLSKDNQISWQTSSWWVKVLIILFGTVGAMPTWILYGVVTFELALKSYRQGHNYYRWLKNAPWPILIREILFVILAVLMSAVTSSNFSGLNLKALPDYGNHSAVSKVFAYILAACGWLGTISINLTSAYRGLYAIFVNQSKIKFLHELVLSVKKLPEEAHKQLTAFLIGENSTEQQVTGYFRDPVTTVEQHWEKKINPHFDVNNRV